MRSRLGPFDVLGIVPCFMSALLLIYGSACPAYTFVYPYIIEEICSWALVMSIDLFVFCWVVLLPTSRNLCRLATG